MTDNSKTTNSKTEAKPTPPSESADAARPAAVRAPAAKCVRCASPVQARYRPFCSQRCAEIDLGQWVSGAYRVPTEDTTANPDDDEAAG